VAKLWDSTLKRLIHADPQAFVSWLAPGTVLIREKPYELEAVKRETDALLLVLSQGQEMLMQIEIQTYHDSAMAKRLLMYNVLAQAQYDLPVLSCVIYLLKDGTIKTSPLVQMLPNGQKVLEFHFLSIELGELSVEDILQSKQGSLLPLLPLTHNGARPEIVTGMFNAIEELGDSYTTKKEELKFIGYALASLVFKRKKSIAEQDWLVRSFREMHDILRDTPIYQLVLQEGRQEGREEGSLATARKMAITAVQVRFPQLLTLAQEQVKRVDDVNTLDDLHIEIIRAQTDEEAKRALLELTKKYNNA